MKEHREAVAAASSDELRIWNRALGPPADRAQQQVADAPADAVIDALEAVDIDQDECGAVAIPGGRAIRHRREPFEERKPVRQPGQRVVKGVV